MSPFDAVSVHAAERLAVLGDLTADRADAGAHPDVDAAVLLAGLEGDLERPRCRSRAASACSVYVPGVLTPVNENVPASPSDALAELNISVPSVRTSVDVAERAARPGDRAADEPYAGFNSTGELDRLAVGARGDDERLGVEPGREKLTS